MYIVETNLPSITIEDLALTVRRGVALRITEDQFKSSLCLRKLVQMGQVRATYKKPRFETKQAPHPKAVRATPPPAPSSTPPVATTPQRKGSKVRKGLPVPPQKMNTSCQSSQNLDELARRTAQEVTSRLSKSGAGQPTLEGLERRVELAVGRALESLRGTGEVPATPTPKRREAPPSSRGPETPLFIPENIVKEGATPTITMGVTDSPIDGLGDAAASLKALRKGAKNQVNHE